MLLKRTDRLLSQQTFICANSKIEAIGKGVKYLQKLSINTSPQRQSRRSDVIIVNFEHVSHLFLVFLLLTLNR